MAYSNPLLSMILWPKRGRLLMNNGSKAQWIAQATDVAIPKASQLILKFMWRQKYNYATVLQN